MPTATGNMTSLNGTKFNSTFLINEIQYSFNGDIDPAVVPFTSSVCTLTYNSVADLTIRRNYEAQIGITKISFNIKNGPTIVGELNQQVSPAANVTGGGTWGAN